MVSRALIEIRMPEGGAEHMVIYETNHRCPQANAQRRNGLGELNDDLDWLVFPVGNYGYSMPLNTAFAVNALDECGACGVLVCAQFVWRKGHVTHAGTLWTP